ncbi:MAG TPA: hypothetical protein VIH93_03530 [Thermoanaerobaculia bacterium]|jgi:hypothetical protein
MKSAARRTVLSASALALAAFTAATTPPPARQGFGENLAVRETEVVFGPDNSLRESEPAEAFVVFDDGHRRPVVRAERLKVDPWTIVVYLDPILAAPDTGFLAALGLSRTSEALAERAEVGIVVADPEPRMVLAPTREPRVLGNRFADLAGELSRRRDRSAGERPPDLTAVRSQLDRMVAFLAGRRQPAPRALFLVADGRDVEPAVLNALGSDRVDPARLPEEGGARAYVRAAQTLAAYGWVILALPFRRAVEPFDLTPPPPSAGIKPGEVLRKLRGMHPRRSPDPFLADYGADSRLAILRAVGRMTDGALVGRAAMLQPAIADLSWRWHLWFSAPSTAVEGRVHPVTVELLRTGEALRATQWVRSGVPEGLADARLGALLAGSPPAGDLPVELRVERAGDEAAVTLRLRTPLPAGTGPLRVSLATDAGGTLRRHVLDGAADTVRVTVPSGARRLAAVVEELEGERWGGAVAALE